MRNVERFARTWGKRVGTVGTVLFVGWALNTTVDQNSESVKGQPLAWPTITPIPTATIDTPATIRAVLTALAPTSTPLVTPNVPATVRAELTAAATPSSAATPDIAGTVQSLLKSIPTQSGSTPDIAGTVSAILTSVPQPPTPVSPATPFILKPEIIKPEVVKPEVVKPEVIVIQPQPASRSAEPDLVGTAISEATLNALVAKDRAALQATATAKMEGTVTAEAKQTASVEAKTATAEARLTPTIAVRTGQNGEGWPWWGIGAIGVAFGALLIAAASNRERVTQYIHEHYHRPPHVP